MVAGLVPALPRCPDFEVNWGLKRALLLSRIGPLAITDIKAKRCSGPQSSSQAVLVPLGTTRLQLLVGRR